MNRSSIVLFKGHICLVAPTESEIKKMQWIIFKSVSFPWISFPDFKFKYSVKFKEKIILKWYNYKRNVQLIGINLLSRVCLFKGEVASSENRTRIDSKNRWEIVRDPVTPKRTLSMPYRVSYQVTSHSELLCLPMSSRWDSWTFLNINYQFKLRQQVYLTGSVFEKDFPIKTGLDLIDTLEIS